MFGAAMACAPASAGCLVTESPSFDPPAQTRPFIVNVQPPPTDTIQAFLQGNNYPLPAIQFQVIAEDAGNKVASKLVIDYGVAPDKLKDPQQFLGERDIGAGHLGDGPRPKPPDSASITPLVGSIYRPQSATDQSCHTITLIATHAFRPSGDTNCPVDVVNDSDQVTWFVVFCAPDLSNCPMVACPVKGETTAYCTNASGAGGGGP